MFGLPENTRHVGRQFLGEGGTSARRSRSLRTLPYQKPPHTLPNRLSYCRRFTYSISAPSRA